MSSFDLVVVGGGPGGYTAAISAAKQGASVCLIEKDQLGGTCTNVGCIPTKVLSSTAHLLKKCRTASEMGIVLDSDARLDFDQVAQRRQEVITKLRDGIEKLLKANKIELIRGTARLESQGQVRIDNQSISAKSIIWASGSTPASLPNIPLSGSQVVSSDQITLSDKLPKRLLVVGGGVIGCEFASIYRAFGVEVVVVELLERLLPTMDPAISSIMKRTFKKEGIQVILKTGVLGVETTDDHVLVHLPEGKQFETDQVLVSVGRTAQTDGLGLVEAGLKLEKGCIVTDSKMATNVDGVYAIGDVVGRTWLAHTAAVEGEVAVANILGKERSMQYDAIPGVVFTDPEVASVGIGQAQAKEQGIDVDVGRFYYAASGKALCDGLSDGRVEIIAEKGSGRVLGGWVAGEQASALISEITMAVTQKVTTRELAEVVHAHPTLPECVMEAAADSYGMAIHRV
jgi:dihydrolipoamide dehydrogenase